MFLKVIRETNVPRKTTPGRIKPSVAIMDFMSTWTVYDIRHLHVVLTTTTVHAEKSRHPKRRRSDAAGRSDIQSFLFALPASRISSLACAAMSCMYRLTVGNARPAIIATRTRSPTVGTSVAGRIPK